MLAQKAGSVVNLIKPNKALKYVSEKAPSASEIKELAKKGLKGGVIGASAAAANGVVAGAATSAVGALAVGGVGAAVLSAAPMVAGFSAACIVGNMVSGAINKE